MTFNKNKLLAKYFSGNASEDEITKILDWIKEHPSHQVEFDELKKLWSVSLNIKKEKNRDVEIAWKNFKELTESQPTSKIIFFHSSRLKIAASVALFIFLSFIVTTFFFNKNSKSAENKLALKKESPIKIKSAEIVTPDKVEIVSKNIPSSQQLPTEQIKIRSKKRSSVITSSINIDYDLVEVVTTDLASIFMLPDKSIVYLNKNSKLTYSKNFYNNHSVSLTGEAFFQVSPDSTQFFITCENTIVQATGSSFNIKSSSDKAVELIVVSGLAEFSGIGKKDFKKLILTPGESAIINKDQNLISKSKNNRSDFQWWKKRNLRAMIKDFFDKIKSKIR